MSNTYYINGKLADNIIDVDRDVMYIANPITPTRNVYSMIVNTKIKFRLAGGNTRTVSGTDIEFDPDPETDTVFITVPDYKLNNYLEDDDE